MDTAILSRAAVLTSAILADCRDRMNTYGEPELQKSLQSAYGWLCRAQDVAGDGGVAAWYHLLHGWARSYPETTGYIIPTFLAYGEVFDDSDAKARALQMADFECLAQLPSGAVRGGQMNTRLAPAVFNTGQVLFGWIAAYQITGDSRYASAATKAAEWLCQAQDPDGAWRKNLSPLTTSPVQTYNVRTAWGLALAGYVLDEPRWTKAARKACDWSLGQQQQNGWFAHDTFGESESPLLHTIGYTLEGLLGAGELLGEERYLEACKRGSLPLVRIFLKSKMLRGRYDQNWRAAAAWRCPTGEAQFAVVLYRLSPHTRLSAPGSLAEVAHELIQQVAATQKMSSAPDIRGAIPGSTPLWGTYAPLKYVNWAAKFYMDALLLGLFQRDVQKHSKERPSKSTVS